MDVTIKIDTEIGLFLSKKYGDNPTNIDSSGIWHKIYNLGIKNDPLYVCIEEFPKWENLNSLGYDDEQLVIYFMEILRNEFPQYKGLIICFEIKLNARTLEDITGIKTL